MLPRAVRLSLLCGGLAWAEPGWAPGAPRYWPRFGGSRAVFLLDGEWGYGYIAGWDSGFDSMSRAFRPSAALAPNATAVPSCMDTVAGGAPGYLGPRGVALYRTTFPTPVAAERPPQTSAPCSVRLQFQACSFYCRVWVNGHEVGEHRAGGYVAFWLDVGSELLSAAGGGNELFVLADNRFNSTTAPMHTGGDFWHYGGIMRSVELHAMRTYPVVWRAYVLPAGADTALPDAARGPSCVDITVVMSKDGSEHDGPIRFTLAFDDGPPQPVTGLVRGGRVELRGVPVPGARLWSPEAPHLHTVAITYRGGSVIERFGLRKFGVAGESARLTINGQITKLVGWNHHTQWPITAASPTDGQIEADVALLKKAHANYVRGAHYPHDPRLLDRLDEAGILFWSETLGPSVSVENMQDWGFFMRYQRQQLQEMMDGALNHASVLAWGWFNEGPSDNESACPAYAACANYSRLRDPTRFTTWADNRQLDGACYAHATLVAFNDYPAWYDRPGDLAYPGRHWAAMAAGVRAGASKSGPQATRGKPMVISETGAGGIFEWSQNETDAMWTLKYQAEVIAADVDAALGNDDISGITLWHFHDFKVDNCGASWPCPKPGGGNENNTHCQYDHPPPATFEELAARGAPNCTSIVVTGRPGGGNHKGSLDFWRREKPAYAVVAEKYRHANSAVVVV